MQDKVIREYVPLRDYGVEVNGLMFWVYAEVQRIEGNYTLVEGKAYFVDKMPPDYYFAFLDSYSAKNGETWRTLIEREVCLYAEKLDAFNWVSEYETQMDRDAAAFDREWMEAK